MPSLDSADGMTNTLGFSRSWKIQHRRITQLDLGANVQWADLHGDDMNYGDGWGGTHESRWDARA